MYYSSNQEDELGFDAFVAPDDFDHTAQPVDIYTKFKEYYPLNNQARYIYYYSDGNYPLTLTPTADEYYKYGYTQGGIDVVVDLALNAAPVTIFGETLTTKRWVIVYKVSTAKFQIDMRSFLKCIWMYCGTSVNSVRICVYGDYNYTTFCKYVHFANLNSMTQITQYTFNTNPSPPLIGRMNIPETIGAFGDNATRSANLITAFNFPNTKDVNLTWDGTYGGNWFPFNGSLIEINLGASTHMPNAEARGSYNLVSRISVSPQNTAYASFPMCDIIYTKDLTTLYWLAPKTVRGLTLPDQLPQAQITALGTKLSANIMQGYPLYIGTLITDITNLYLSNKSFSTIGVGAGNTAFSASGNMLLNAAQTSLLKVGTSNTGALIIPNVQMIEANCFLHCTGYTGNLTIPNTVTSIASGALNGLTNLTTLTLPVGFDTNIYNNFSFANFTAASLNTAIQNLASGTVGTPRYFYISKTSFDALNVAYPNAVSDAAARYINVKGGIVQDSSLKLWLDAGNTLSYPGSGTAWSDLSGNGNNGTLVNGVAFSTANGGVMSFDGVNDYVDCGKSTSIKPTSMITINTWIYFNATFGSGNRYLSDWHQDGSEDRWIFYTTGTNKITFYISTSGPSSYTCPINTWINICGTYDSTIGGTNSHKLYINGVLFSQMNRTGTLVPGVNGTVKLGGQVSAGGYLNGIINDTLIYNRALTPAEITQNFETTRSKYRI